MLANPGNKNIFIHKYDQDLLPKNMLALLLFIICSPTTVYLEVISDMKFYLCVKKSMIYYRIKIKKILPSIFLSSFLIHNSSVTDIYM